MFSVGKTALFMFQGLPDDWRSHSTGLLLVTRIGHLGGAVLDRNVAAFEAVHPVPDRKSLAAGACVVNLANGLRDLLLMLFSGRESCLIDNSTQADVCRDCYA